MLHLRLTPNDPRPSSENGGEDADKTLAGVLSFLEEREGDASYVRSVKRCVAIIGLPLSLIPADLDAFDRQFPRKSGFHPELWKTPAAFEGWRRNVRGAIGQFLGLRSAKAERRARTDDWAELAERLSKRRGTNTALGDVLPQSLIPISVLADEARQRDVGLRDLTSAHIAAIADGVRGNRRTSVERAARLLEQWRAFPEVAELLPSVELEDPRRRRRAQPGAIPSGLLDEIEAWVATANRREFDPILEEWRVQNAPATCARHRAALRKYVATALSLPLNATPLTLAACFTRDLVVDVVRALRRPGLDQQISDRTIALYFRDLTVLLARNGHGDLAGMVKDLRTSSAVLGGAQVARQERTMSAATRAFCRPLVSQMDARRRFLSSHLALQAKAQDILDRCAQDGRAPTGREVERVRAFGASAAFVAIALCGVPLRVGNAMALTLQGPDASLRMPTRHSPWARLLIPGDAVKNGKGIDARIENTPDFRGLDVLSWYLTHVRPLFPGAVGSPWVFPTVMRSNQHLRTTVFRQWFRNCTRSIGLPMNPHNLRHGVATILYANRKLSLDQIAVHLGDTPRTVMTYYAWVDELQVRSDVQSALLSEVKP